MGDLLVRIYDVVTQKGGFEGRLHFAEKVKVSKNKAAEVDDSPELVDKFKTAAKSILGEDIDSYLD